MAMGVQGRVRPLAAPLLILLVLAAMLASLWSSIGPHHGAFAWCVALAAFAVPFFLGTPLVDILPEGLFKLRPAQLRLIGLLGVRRFDRFLTMIGWNAAVAGMRGGVAGPGGAARLAVHMKSSAAAHAVGLLVHGCMGLLALSAGAYATALCLFVAAVPLHLHPVLLQLWNLHRLDAVRSRRP